MATGSRYKLLEKLGEGGMGVVYKALDTRLGRTVAIKMLPPEFISDEERKERLTREARAASALSHPNICTIHDIDEVDGSLFIVMEYVRGKTLAEAIATHSLDIHRTLKIAIAVADALEKVHRLNIVHRDIKPSNILLTEEEQPKILDFGLAHPATLERDSDPLGDSHASTLEVDFHESGRISGTPAYMSPEQIRAEELDVRSDIFSFGVMLYEMLAGKPPFHGKTLLEVVSSILKEAPQPLAKSSTGVPSSLVRITEKALAKDRDARYQSMKELLADLQKVRSQEKEESELPKVAVQYFENLSGEKEDEYFRDGMTEDIITELWKIKNLKVFPRSAVMAYRNRSLTAVQIGQELQASHVLEGSIRRAGSHLRISTELVAIDSGHAVWASRFDRELKDIFAVQDEIACSIAQALRITLSPQEEVAIASKPTENTQAYDYYLRGRSYARRASRPDLEIALQMYEYAIALDPNFTLGYAGIGYIHGLLYFAYGGKPSWIDIGLEACERALSIEPDQPDALAARAVIFVSCGRYEESIRDAQRAVGIKPDCQGGYWALGGALFASDRWADAAAIADRAVETSGDDQRVYVPFVMSLERLGDAAGAMALRRRHTHALEQQLELVPDDVLSRILLANQYARFGREADAVRELDKALALRPQDSMILYNAACTYGLLRMKTEALALLKQTRDRGFHNMDWVARDPDLVFLHGDPQFESLIK